MKYLLLSLLPFICTGTLSSQELILDDGIYCEKPLPKDTATHKYTKDNLSYKLNRVFVFDYYYQDKYGLKKKFIHTDDISSMENPLNLARYDSKQGNVIDKVKMEISDDRSFFKHDPNDAQTVCCYTFIQKNGKSSDSLAPVKKPGTVAPCGDESTGIIDNKKNVWIHPPRKNTFKILQFNPFPFYVLDETVSNWAWNLETGGFYMDPRWIKYTQNIKIHFNYNRMPDETIDTPMGKLTCKVTEGTGTAEVPGENFKTQLKSFYHHDYGFVRLEYTNINSTKLIMQLIEAK
ncbi:MAG: hypothetical protein H0W61_16655 [Bacteroidetes bacterium]|nr:hypothetical protein [Bacteroidota bacterium]